MRITVITLLLVAGIAGQAAAQPELNDRRVTVPSLFVDMLSYAGTDTGSSRLEIYIQVPYEEVRFTRREDEFVGIFDLVVGITTPEDEPVFNRSQTVEIRTKEFSQTTSNRLSSLKQMTFDLRPGQYNVRVEMRDQDSRTTAVVRRKLLVTDYHRTAVAMSDVMLVNRLTTSGDRKIIVPNISGNVGDEADGFYLFFELYAPPASGSLSLTATVQNARRDSVAGYAQADTSTGPVRQVFMKFQDVELPIGVYLVRIDARATAGGPILATTTRTLAIRWSDIPFSITDIDKAIDQMRYIARDAELDRIREGTTPEEKRARFLDFWTKRDPDPQTARNELMEEYYHRVEYSDRNFSHYVEGWRTDRGMVYIRYGAPDNIERHPFETNSRPYEVWRYYNLNYEFVFVDETGFGDYRLRYPSTDLLGRIRDQQ